MRLLVTAQRSELGAVLARARGPDHGDGPVVAVNLALQEPNTLLHDGQAWWDDPAAHIVATTRRALQTARRERATFVVHASYAFLDNAESGARVGRRLRPIIAAASEAEEMVLDGDVPGCVVRLGYLYGAGWRDLRAYRRAFRIGRPYWAGPRHALQHHLHGDDAARALLLAARTRPAGRRVYVTDGQPASFADFMDHFAHLVGRSRPLHLPRLSRHLVGLVVLPEHIEMVEMEAQGRAAPRLPGWRPELAGYRAGLAEVLEAWRRR